MLVCIAHGGVNVIRRVEESGPLLQRSGQRVSSSVIRTNAAGLKDEDGTASGETEVAIVLKVIAESRGGDQARRNRKVGANVRRAVRSPKTESVGEHKRGRSGIHVKHPRC